VSDHNEIKSTITIARPAHEVYVFYRDMTHFPLFLGDVMAVEPAGPDRYRWTIQEPLGTEIHWIIEVLEAQPDTLLRYGTETAAGLRAIWTTTFEPADQEAAVRVTQSLHMPFEPLSGAVLSLMGKSPQAEVEANLRRLKELLETGKVVTLAHAVPGKFAE
jgi:uncharacterized membrane protein